MISKRTLEQWRRDALGKMSETHKIVNGEALNVAILKEMELNNRILRLTRELLDQYLMKRT